MPIRHRSPAVTLGSIARHTTSAVLTTFALCTPALSQTTLPELLTADGQPREFVSENVRVGTEGVLVTDLSVANREQVAETMARPTAAQTTTARAPSRRRLGRWAIIPGAFLGAMLGGAVNCLVTRCTSNIPTGVFPGMLVGAATSALAPRRVAGTFLGVGGGFVAGSLIAPAIEGDCADHPCTRGALVGDTVGAAAGGLLGYRLSGQ